MSARADLTDQQIGEWRVVVKAPAVKRIPHWTLEHEGGPLAVAGSPCGARVDVPHTVVLAASKGKGSLPPCVACTPAEQLPGISHGMHLACGAVHMIGTPCGKAGPGECQHGYGWQTCPACTPGSFLEGVSHAQAVGLPAPGAYVVEKVPGGTVMRLARELDLAAFAEPSAELDLAAFLDVDPSFVPEVHQPVTPAEHALVAATDAVYAARALELPAPEVPAPEGVIYGRANRCLGPEAHLEMIAAAVSSPAKGATGRAGMSALAGCERKLGYRLLLGRPAGGPAWRPFVGTATHGRDQAPPPGDEWRGPINLSEIYRADNERRIAAGLPARWLIGLKVTEPAWGEVDVFDLELGEAVDWKVPGITTVKKSWRGQVSENYRGQVQLNGLALELLGYTVRRVSVLFLPAAGELDDAGWWSAPYDAATAWALVARRDRINAMHAAAEAAGTPEPERVVLSLLSTREDYCSYCPAFTQGLCPGEIPPPKDAPTPKLELVR